MPNLRFGSWLLGCLLWLAVGPEGRLLALQPTVILISLDGVRHDAPDKADFPGFQRLIREGIRADHLIPVYPTVSFPCHVSMVTGTWPDVHGIIDNEFYDRERGLYDYSADEADWIMAEPLWAAAERQGIQTAVNFWIGSGSPWQGQSASFYKVPFSKRRSRESSEVRQILQWLDLPLDERPRLIVSHWYGVDVLSHRQGPEHPEVVKRLKKKDGRLQQLMEGLDERRLWANTTMILVSDHGLTEAQTNIDVKGMLKKAGIQARVTGGAAMLNIYIEDESLRQQAFELLSQVPHIKVERPFEIEHSKRLVHSSRTGDLVVTTTPPYTFFKLNALQASGFRLMARHRGWRLGMDGYPPSLYSDMNGIFMAIGRGVPTGRRIQAVHSIDIAATISSLLGMEPPAQSEGKSFLPLL